jgi:hypothetical protein
MVSRRVGRAISFAALMLATLALAVPPTATAADYKVLVVTSADDALSKAGVSAIRSAGRSAGFSVTAPSPADVGDQFTAKRLEQYRTVVFLNTGAASPLTGRRATTCSISTGSSSPAGVSGRRSVNYRAGCPRGWPVAPVRGGEESS